mmetsp:Transcript_16470/g.49327  ORF Transcript_16470/g.49327 Transcript_16470/m.49327 type:complete len:505 (+) Transcript_16470:419-1933(+)
MDQAEALGHHARSGSSNSLPGLSVNRSGSGGGVPPEDEAAAAAAHASPSPKYSTQAQSQQPGCLRRCWWRLPSASGLVTVGFASLLLYLTVARKCNDGSWPQACAAMHLHSDVKWVTYRKSGPRDPTRCNEVLDVKRVALMFLSAEGLHHEDTWRDWFKDAGGLVPKERVKEHGCGDKQLKRLVRSCGIRPDASPLDRQFLFNVYMHPSSSFKGHPKSSVFYGKEIAHRITTSHGAPALMDAIRALLVAALAQPHNSQFVLLSESEVPLYPAAVVWRQLQGETKSRINACKGGHVDHDQWPEFMPKDTIMQHKDWRKSPAWFGLLRKHAELAVQDVTYLATMKENCKAGTMINKKWRICYLDEHYIPSLLAFHGLDDETDCRGGLVTANWTLPGAKHPLEYQPRQVKPALFKRLRADVYFGKRLDWGACKAEDAIKRGLGSFARADEVNSRSCRSKSRWSQRNLKYKCPLFARKFRNDTARAVHDALIDCEAGLKILDLGDGCS